MSLPSGSALTMAPTPGRQCVNCSGEFSFFAISGVVSQLSCSGNGAKLCAFGAGIMFIYMKFALIDSPRQLRCTPKTVSMVASPCGHQNSSAQQSFNRHHLCPKKRVAESSRSRALVALAVIPGRVTNRTFTGQHTEHHHITYK